MKVGQNRSTLADNGVTPAKLSNPTGEIGYAERSTGQSGINSTTLIDLTGLSVTVNVPSGTTLKITGWLPQLGSTVANDRADFYIREGTTSLGVLYATMSGNGGVQSVTARIQPTAGSHTYKLTLARGIGTGSISYYADSSTKGFIMVERVF